MSFVLSFDGMAQASAVIAAVVLAAVGCSPPTSPTTLAPAADGSSAHAPPLGETASATAQRADGPRGHGSGAAHGLPPIDPSLGRLVPRVKRDSFPTPEDVPGSFEDLAATGEDELWVVGMGNLRLRCDAQACEPMPAATTRVPLGVVPGTCEAVPHFWHLFASKTAGVYVASTSGCGMDPSYVYNRPIERFDGRRWQPLPGSQLAASPSQRSIRAMHAAGNAHLWVVVEGFDWEGALGNAIQRYGGSRYAAPSRLGLAGAERAAFEKATSSPSSSPPTHVGWESFRAIVSRDDGWAWVVGSKVALDRSDTGERRRVTPAAWVFDGQRWADAPLPPMSALSEHEELEALAIGADGSVWVGGDGLSLWQGDRFSPVDLGWSQPLVVRSIYAVDRGNVWMVAAAPTGPTAGSQAVLHFDGARLARLAIDRAGDEVTKLAGRGSSLHALGRNTLWRLER